MHTSIIARLASIVFVVAAIGVLPLGCQTTEPGVKSSGFDQYTNIEATTADATNASAAVLKDLGLLNIESSFTNVDGWARGTKADKTPVVVTLTRESERISEISVKIGSFGDTDLGQDIIARVRRHLGLIPPSTSTDASK